MKNFNSSVARRRRSTKLRQRRSSATTKKAKGFSPKTTKVKKGEWTVFTGLCKGCGLCLAKCPSQALLFGQKKGLTDKPIPQVIAEKCRLCQTCEVNCPELAIRVDKK